MKVYGNLARSTRQQGGCARAEVLDPVYGPFALDGNKVPAEKGRDVCFGWCDSTLPRIVLLASVRLTHRREQKVKGGEHWPGKGACHISATGARSHRSPPPPVSQPPASCCSLDMRILLDI